MSNESEKVDSGTQISTSFDKSRFYDYITNGINKVEGWVVKDVLWLIDIASDIHQKYNIFGGALEIGVHHGRFFIALENLCRPDERAVAIDLFDMQNLNIDKSGHGNYSKFMENCELFCLAPNRVDTVKADSLMINASDVSDLFKKYGKFRFISIDGGHTPVHVQSDLRIAEQLIVNGGIVLVDDFFNCSWPGVTEGVLQYLHRGDSPLVPVCIIGNKLALTTLSWHASMYDILRVTFKSISTFNRVDEIQLVGTDLIFAKI